MRELGTTDARSAPDEMRFASAPLPGLSEFLDTYLSFRPLQKECSPTYRNYYNAF
jgi:hypothetical protein